MCVVLLFPQAVPKFLELFKDNLDRERAKTLKVIMCTAVVRIVDFLTVILKIPSVQSSVLHLWTTELSRLISL